MSQPLNISDEKFEDFLKQIRRVAYELVADADYAEDLTQEAGLRLLRQPPSTTERFAGWAKRVVRNLTIDDSRRRRPESLGDRVDAGVRFADAADKSLEEIEFVHSIWEHVRALDEVYRVALHERFLLGSSVEEAAIKFGVPVSTMRSRITRGREQLRERLDRDSGGRENWMAMLAPFAGVGLERSARMGRRFGVLSAGAVAATVAIAACAVGALYLAFSGDDGPDRSVAAAEAVASAGGRVPATMLLGASAGDSESAAELDGASATKVEDRRTQGLLLDGLVALAIQVEVYEHAYLDPVLEWRPKLSSNATGTPVAGWQRVPEDGALWAPPETDEIQLRVGGDGRIVRASAGRAGVPKEWIWSDPPPGGALQLWIDTEIAARVRILGPAGPAASLALHLDFGDRLTWRGVAQTDDDGYAELRFADLVSEISGPTPTVTSIFVNAPDFYELRFDRELNGPEHTFTLPTYGPLQSPTELIVQDPRGAPVTNAVAKRSTQELGAADDQGRIAVTGLMRMEHTLAVVSRSHGAAALDLSKAPSTLVVLERAARLALEFAQPDSSASIRLRLSRPDGESPLQVSPNLEAGQPLSPLLDRRVAVSPPARHLLDKDGALNLEVGLAATEIRMLRPGSLQVEVLGTLGETQGVYAVELVAGETFSQAVDVSDPVRLFGALSTDGAALPEELTLAQASVASAPARLPINTDGSFDFWMVLLPETSFVIQRADEVLLELPTLDATTGPLEIDL